MRALALAFLAFLALTAACGKENKERAQAIYHLVDARLHYLKGDYAVAEQLYERYLQMAPDGEFSWEAWNRRVFIWLTVNNNSTQAAELLKEMAVEYSDAPDRMATILMQLTNAYESAMEVEGALDAWETYLTLETLEPVNATMAYHHIARLEQERRGYDQALAALDKCIAVASGPDAQTPGVQQQRYLCVYDKARTKLMQLRAEEAQVLLESLLKEPEVNADLNATAGYVLAEIYRTQNSPDKAVAVLKSIQEWYPNPIVVKKRLEKLEQAKKEAPKTTQ